MLEAGRVSIITPAFNSAKLIGETIESVIAQTYQNWEMLIVIDQGTQDNTADVVRKYSQTNPQIRLLEIKNQRGISLSRNLALREASGQYVAFLDSDDLWLPLKLERQLAVMRESKAAFSCAGYRRINLENTKLGQLILPPERQNYFSVLGNNLISCPTVVIDQIKTGPLTMAEFAHEDYILWLSILRRGFECVGVQEDLARYRIVPNSRSMNVNRSGSRWQVYREFEKLSVIKSAFHFAVYAVTAITKRIQF